MRFPFAVAVAAVAALAPARGQPPAAPLNKIAFGSCADQDKPLPIFDTIAATKPDLFLFLGDNIYADIDPKTNKLVPAAKVTPELIKSKYAVLADLPGFRKLKATCPFMATWDDHDYGANDAGGDFAIKDESQRLFLDFFGAGPDDPRRKQKGVYSAAVFGPPGKRVQVIMLDTRYHRSKLTRAKSPPPGEKGAPPYVPDASKDATVLGEDQWAWLEAQLKVPAEVRLVGSSIQLVADEHGFEKWANFPRERDRFYDLVRKTGAAGVVVLSGDRHHGEISLDPAGAGYPVYDVTSSGLNQGAKAWRLPDRNAHRVAAMPYGDNFGMVLIDWSGDDPRLTLQLRDEEGDVIGAAKVRLSTLRPAGVAGPRPALPAGVLTPAEATQKACEKVTVQFAVQSTGGQTNLYLNSSKDFRAKHNFAVALSPAARAGRWADATGATFQGKTIRATGVVQVINGSGRIEVTEPGQLAVVE